MICTCVSVDLRKSLCLYPNGGNSLAIRLPAAVVEILALKEGDEVEITVADCPRFDVSRKASREELLKRELLRPRKGLTSNNEAGQRAETAWSNGKSSISASKRADLNGGFRAIFRVPEYSELSIHTGVRSRSDQEGRVTKLGIFLSANLAAAVEVVDD